MKKIANFFLFSSLLVTMVSSCKKEDKPQNKPEEKVTAYADIKKEHIAAKDATLSSDEFEASNAEGLVMKPSDVLIYKTSSGLYGKMEIVAIDKENNYKLKFNAVTYKADGSILKEGKDLYVRGTYNFNLETLEEISEENAYDFSWSRSSTLVTYFQPANKAKFSKYEF